MTTIESIMGYNFPKIAPFFILLGMLLGDIAGQKHRDLLEILQLVKRQTQVTMWVVEEIHSMDKLTCSFQVKRHLLYKTQNKMVFFQTKKSQTYSISSMFHISSVMFVIFYCVFPFMFYIACTWFHFHLFLVNPLQLPCAHLFTCSCIYSQFF